jgi:GNAT superfamily N-acetyltransferase
VTAPTVVPAAPADLDAAAALLADAFEGEPQVAALVGDRPDARRRRFHLYRAELARPVAEGTVDLARDPGNGALLGVAAWHGPHPAAGPAAVLSVRSVRSVLDHLRAFGVTGLGRALAAQRAFGRARPRTPHWYLEAVGVAPAGQGRGVGRALLEHRLERIDARGGAGYLESSSPRTTPLYRRLGFVPLGPVRGLPSAEPPLAMWRPATPRT